MKYLDVPDFAKIASLLSDIDSGDSAIIAYLDAFSCKKTSEDKQVSKSLENSIKHSYDDSSPFGRLDDQSSRKTFINLIMTLNLVFPDYDFSDLPPDAFENMQNIAMLQNETNQAISEVLGRQSDVQIELDEVWKCIDENIDLKECDVYQYLPDADTNPLQDDEGLYWSFFYFFYNRKLKRIVFFAASCESRSHIGNREEEEEEEELEFPFQSE
eukprot:TRINITY_DN397_c0_g1_i3.p1 TRINITY_DN397_c0_g1~~TRINITY_DN397_c0_g1_i3.p1  ORF type:complete len:238 (-),score=52.09 TRINITY_DN397_c0_g1_i3:72-713(-)